MGHSPPSARSCTLPLTPLPCPLAPPPSVPLSVLLSWLCRQSVAIKRKISGKTKGEQVSDKQWQKSKEWRKSEGRNKEVYELFFKAGKPLKEWEEVRTAYSRC